MSLLEVDDLVVQFGGVTAVDHASFTAEAGTHHRPDRPQRRRQDHLLQRDQRAAEAHPRAGSASTAATSAHTPVHRRAQARHGPHLPAAGGVRVAHRPRQRAGRPRHPPRSARRASGRSRPTSTSCSSGSASRSTPTSAPTRSRPARPGCWSWPAAWPPTPSCCSSTSPPRVCPRSRPTRSASCSRDLADEGRGGADGRARHGPGDDRLRHDPGARLRQGDRDRQPRPRSAADPRVQQAYLGYSDEREPDPTVTHAASAAVEGVV